MNFTHFSFLTFGKGKKFLTPESTKISIQIFFYKYIIKLIYLFIYAFKILSISNFHKNIELKHSKIVIFLCFCIFIIFEIHYLLIF